MKIIIFLYILSLLTFGNAHAQLKHFLPRSNSVMSILDHKYWFEGDTIIDNVRYTRIYRQKCESEIECGELSYYAAVREDTIGEKIYAVFPCDSAMLPYSPYLCDEVLLADFNVQAGDQIKVYCKWPGLSERWITVDDVDSIWIDNQYRKRINMVDYYSNTNWPPDSWVEGIGSIVYGLFFPSPEAMALGDSPKFLCMHLNGELLYRNPIYDTCFLPDGGTAIPFIGSKERGIYYSIENEQLYIYGNYTYRIYDVRGSLVLSGIYSSAPINISQLATGVYFLQLYDDKKPVYSDKFVKY
jgi:hypothetical protein